SSCIEGGCACGHGLDGGAQLGQGIELVVSIRAVQPPGDHSWVEQPPSALRLDDEPDPSPGHDEPGSFEGAHDLSSDRARDLVLRLDVVETQDLADGQLAVDDLLGDRLDHRAVQHFCWHMPSDLRWP